MVLKYTKIQILLILIFFCITIFAENKVSGNIGNISSIYKTITIDIGLKQDIEHDDVIYVYTKSGKFVTKLIVVEENEYMSVCKPENPADFSKIKYNHVVYNYEKPPVIEPVVVEQTKIPELEVKEEIDESISESTPVLEAKQNDSTAVPDTVSENNDNEKLKFELDNAKNQAEEKAKLLAEIEARKKVEEEAKRKAEEKVKAEKEKEILVAKPVEVESPVEEIETSAEKIDEPVVEVEYKDELEEKDDKKDETVQPVETSEKDIEKPDDYDEPPDKTIPNEIVEEPIQEKPSNIITDKPDKVETKPEKKYKFKFSKDLKISLSGHYEAYYAFSRDKHLDDQWRLSHFPKPNKVWKAKEPDEDGFFYSSYNDLAAWPDREPNHKAYLQVNVTNDKNLSTEFSFEGNSSNDRDRLNNVHPVYLQNGNINYKICNINVRLYSRENPGKIDDPLIIFEPGRRDDYLFYDYNHTRYVLDWDGRGSQGIKLDYQDSKHDAKFYIVDGFSRIYYNWQGYQFYNDDFTLIGRYNYNLNEKTKIGTTMIKRAWAVEGKEALGSDKTNQLSINVSSIYTSIKLKNNLIIEGEMANTFTSYIDWYIFNKGSAYCINLKNQVEGKNIKLQLRYIGPSFVADYAYFNPDEKAITLDSNFKLNEKIRLWFFADYKMNIYNEYPFFDIKSSLDVQLTEKVNYKLQFQKTDFDVWDPHKSRNKSAVKQSMEFKLMENFYSAIGHKITSMHYLRNEEPYYENEIYFNFWTKLFGRLDVNFNYKVIDNMIITNRDEFYFWLNREDKIESGKIQKDDDWIETPDFLTHSFFDFKIGMSITDNTYTEIKYILNDWDQKLEFKLSTGF